MLRSLLKNVKRPVIDFATLKKSRKPNTYLVAPKELCLYEPAEESPQFNISQQALLEIFSAIAAAAPNTEKLSEMSVGTDWQVEYVQYSKGLGFPDTITVRFMALGEGRSTVAVYSRSHYGYRDFGVNRKRVQSWIGQVTEKLEN